MFGTKCFEHCSVTLSQEHAIAQELNVQLGSLDRFVPRERVGSGDETIRPLFVHGCFALALSKKN